MSAVANKTFGEYRNERRKPASLLARVRHWESASMDDALDLLDILMASRLPARTDREEQEPLRSVPGRRCAIYRKTVDAARPRRLAI